MARYGAWAHDSPEEKAVGQRRYRGRLVRAFWPFLRPYLGFMLLASGLSVLSALLDLAGPAVCRLIVDEAVQSAGTSRLVDLTVLWSLLVAGTFGLNIAIRLLVTWTGQSAMLDMRQAIFRHLQYLDVSFYDQTRVGRLLTRVMNDVASFNELFSMGIPTFFRDLLVLAGIVVALFLLDPRLAAFVSVCFPPLALGTYAFSRAIRGFYRRTRLRLAALNAFLQENLTGMQTVQLFSAEGRQHRRFRDLNSALRDAHLGTVFVFALLFPALELITAAGIAVILYDGGLRLLSGEITFGVLTAFLLYLKRFVMPLRDLAEKFNMIESARASAERIFELLSTQPGIVDIPKPQVPRPQEEIIRFENVSFAYKEGEWVLRDVTFSVARGSTVAIVGPTGSGKTTVVNLLLRFYDPTCGRILLGGVDIRTMAQQDLRRRMAVVPQDIVLFRGTVADNIRLSDPALPEKEVRRAAEAAHAASFIDDVPGGLSSQITEGGGTLSTGQKQLLALARAMASPGDIVLLDEATAHIDARSEQLIQDALNRLLREKTALVVAHRLSTIKQADTIVVLHRGRIRECGNHSELLQRGGLYATLCRLQSIPQ